MTNSTKKVITMFASDFSAYGKIQAMKSTLRYLAQDAGHRFIFVNDPKRGDQAKIKFGSETVVVADMQPAEMNQHIGAM